MFIQTLPYETYVIKANPKAYLCQTIKWELMFLKIYIVDNYALNN